MPIMRLTLLQQHLSTGEFRFFLVMNEPFGSLIKELTYEECASIFHLCGPRNEWSTGRADPLETSSNPSPEG